jgi:hypothetical protein
MQIPFKPVRQTRSGFALMTTLAFMAAALLVFASIMYLVCGDSKRTSQNNLYNISQAAAEGATEMVIAQMDHDFLCQSLQNASVYAGMIPTNVMQTNNWPVQFQFSDTNGNVNQISVTIAPLNYSTNWVTLYDPQFNGLNAAVAFCTVFATATPVNQSYGTAANVSQVVQMASIPVFQFGVYYNMDMDLSNGQQMTMNGTTFVNGNLYMYPQALMTFNGSVEATLNVTNVDDPNDQQNLTSYTTPTYNFTANGGKPLSKADSVSLPIGGPNSNPTNIESLLNLPPAALAVPNAVGYLPTNLTSYLYNAATLIISNSVSGTNGNGYWGTNFSVYFNDSYAQTLTLLTNDLQWANGSVYYVTNGSGVNKTITTNPVVLKFYSFLTNVSFYDFREVKTVQAVQIDVAKFDIWLTNTATRLSGGTTNYVAGNYWNNLSWTDNNSGLNAIYVYNSVPLSSTTLPAVRLVNGYQLPFSTNGTYPTRGLTVATPMPIYVLGNYNIQTNSGGSQSVQTTNTAWTWPAALMGDSITTLSSNWSDANNSGTALGSRTTLNTTINAACLEGIVPSTYTTHKQYSGGLENFLRLEESWSSTLCYNGSIVVMFPSIYATNFWTGPSQISGYPAPYYAVPTRKWGFDANFMQQSKLPPMTPQVKTMIRGQWTR